MKMMSEEEGSALVEEHDGGVVDVADAPPDCFHRESRRTMMDDTT